MPIPHVTDREYQYMEPHCPNLWRLSPDPVPLPDEQTHHSTKRMHLRLVGKGYLNQGGGSYPRGHGSDPELHLIKGGVLI